MRSIVGLIIVLGALVTAASGCSTRSGEPGAAAAGTPWKKTALWVKDEDQTRPFENGTALAAGDLNVEVFVAPYPPSREGSINLRVTDRATNRPIEDAVVKVTFDMYMPHGDVWAESLATGGGRFLVPYKLVMPGEWQAEVVIRRGGDVASLAVIFRLD